MPADVTATKRPAERALSVMGLRLFPEPSIAGARGGAASAVSSISSVVRAICLWRVPLRLAHHTRTPPLGREAAGAGSWTLTCRMQGRTKNSIYSRKFRLVLRGVSSLGFTLIRGVLLRAFLFWLKFRKSGANGGHTGREGRFLSDPFDLRK
jgi:hypothetical protein